MSDQLRPERLAALAKTLVEAGEELAELVRTWPEAESLRKLAYEHIPHPEISTLLFLRLQELEPENAQIVADLGLVYWLSGDEEDAVLLAEKARALDPKNVQGLLLRAAVSREESEKRALYREILEIDPGNEIARENLRGGAVARRIASV